MPRIDPRLAAIMAVAVILSTLVVLTVFKGIRPDPITVLRNTFPEVFVKESAQKGIETTFSFGAISGRAMKELQLRFSILYEEPPPYEEGWLPRADTPLTEVESHIPVITSLKSKVESLGGDMEILERNLDVNGTKYQALLYDFSGFLGIFCDEEELSRWTSLFAILRKGEEVRFFKGRTGFFLSQERTVRYLMISHNDNKTEYLGAGIRNAPYGILTYTDVDGDDKITVIFEVMVSAEDLLEIPMGATQRMIMQLIKGYSDAELTMLVASGVPMG